MTEIRHITPREQALERENARLVDKTERQSATIHVQAVAIQSMQEEIAKLKAQPVQEPAVTGETNHLLQDASKELGKWLASKPDAKQRVREVFEAQPVQEPYPEGDVVGPCVCGSWPGGKCLKCERIDPSQPVQPAPKGETK